MRKILEAIGGVLLWAVTGIAKFAVTLIMLAPFVLPIIASHELGHYAVMRYFGAPVAEVSVGIGWRVCCFAHAGTEWCLRLIPLAGYAMPTSEGLEIIEALPVLPQIAIYIAGIAVNLLTVVVLATFLQWWYKRPPLLQLAGYALKTAAKLPLAFLGFAFMAVTSIITWLIPSFRPRIPFSEMVTLPQGAQSSPIRAWLVLALIVGLLNLLPFYPFDGGRILDALIPLITSSHTIRELIQHIGFWLALFVFLFGGRGRDDFNYIRYESPDKGKRVEFTVLTASQDGEEPRIVLLQTEEGRVSIALTRVEEDDDAPAQGSRSVSFSGRIVEEGGKFAEWIHGTITEEADAEHLSGWFEIE